MSEEATQIFLTLSLLLNPWPCNKRNNKFKIPFHLQFLLHCILPTALREFPYAYMTIFKKVFSIIPHLISDSLRVGSRRDSSYSREFGCQYCEKVVVGNIWNLRRHVNAVHLNIRPYKCRYCDVTFNQNSNRKSHEVKHHTPDREHA